MISCPPLCVLQPHEDLLFTLYFSATAVGHFLSRARMNVQRHALFSEEEALLSDDAVLVRLITDPINNTLQSFLFTHQNHLSVVTVGTVPQYSGLNDP